MIILKIVEALIFLGIFVVLVGVVWNFIKDMRRHNKRMRKLDQWSQFHKQSMEWAKEIVDVNVRVDFLNKCVSKLSKTNNGNSGIGNLDDWDIEEEKMKICSEWGHHIPSLVQEIRENKLNQIL
jgi:hypothetical protein